jgi:hypothetical protein
VEWKSYGPGHLAKSDHGFYMVYQNLDLALGCVRWFAKYQGHSDDFSKREDWIDFQFFDSLEAAQAHCEMHAQSLNP